eukprot:6013747-Amphidinium_carterae.1
MKESCTKTAAKNTLSMSDTELKIRSEIEFPQQEDYEKKRARPQQATSKVLGKQARKIKEFPIKTVKHQCC